MPKLAAIRPDFSAGELSPKLYGRSDYEFYNRGARTMRDFLVTRQGPALFRPGTQFVQETKTSTTASRLLRFQYSITQTYIIELGDTYLRLHGGGSRPTPPPTGRDVTQLRGPDG